MEKKGVSNIYQPSGFNLNYKSLALSSKPKTITINNKLLPYSKSSFFVFERLEISKFSLFKYFLNPF